MLYEVITRVDGGVGAVMARGTRSTVSALTVALAGALAFGCSANPSPGGGGMGGAGATGGGGMGGSGGAGGQEPACSEQIADGSFEEARNNFV